MRFRTYITESIMHLDNKDIDMLWKPVRKMATKLFKAADKKDVRRLKQLFNNIANSYPIKSPGGEGSEILVIDEFSSEDFVSPLAQVAHNINPIKIYVGFPIHSPQYSADRNYITLGIPINILTYFKNKRSMEQMQDNDLLFFMQNAFSYYNNRSVMRHELTHWLDDTFHGRHILQKTETGRMQQFNVPSSPTEIQAIVHQIHQLRRDIRGAEWIEDPQKVIPWNKMDFNDLTYMIPGLRIQIMNDPEFTKKLLSRLWREKLLTPKMWKSLKQ